MMVNAWHGKPVDLEDERVTVAVTMGERCPAQYEGRLIDGRWFYFRYRWGWAYVGVGATLDEAIDCDSHERTYGLAYDGEWPDEATRNAAFTELLSATLSAQTGAGDTGDPGAP